MNQNFLMITIGITFMLLTSVAYLYSRKKIKHTNKYYTTMILATPFAMTLLAWGLSTILSLLMVMVITMIFLAPWVGISVAVTNVWLSGIRKDSVNHESK